MATLIFPISPAHLDTYTDGNQAIWQYDSDGPYWNVITSTTRKNFSGVKANLIAGFDLTSSYQLVEFDDIKFEVDTYSTTPTGRFIAPTTGFYRISVIVFSTSVGSGSSYDINIRKNGSNLNTTTIGPNQSTTYDQTLSLVAGDYIEVFAKEPNGGALTLTSEFTMYRLGYAPGTGISNHNAFSGVRVIPSGAVNTTSSATAVTWSSADFNVNANVLGDLYWYNSVPNRVTVRNDGYYKFRCFVQAGTGGAANSYTINVRKNGTTSLVSTTLSANDFVELDEIFILLEDDYIELMISNSDNTGSILSTTYLELVREGV